MPRIQCLESLFLFNKEYSFPSVAGIFLKTNKKKENTKVTKRKLGYKN